MPEQLPVWNNPGIEPSTDLKVNGWQPGQKPSAQHFNWLFNRAYKCLEELQGDSAKITELEQTLTELEQTVTLNNEKFNEHLAETSGKHIHSSGGNANGNFVKFDDGTLLCYRMLNITVTTINTLTSLDWLFPVPFVNGWFGFANVKGYSATDEFNLNRLDLFGFNDDKAVLQIQASYAQTYNVSVLAIGRWK